VKLRLPRIVRQSRLLVPVLAALTVLITIVAMTEGVKPSRLADSSTTIGCSARYTVTNRWTGGFYAIVAPSVFQRNETTCTDAPTARSGTARSASSSPSPTSTTSPRSPRSPSPSPLAPTERSARASPFALGSAPQLQVSGNELVDASGHQVVLHGVDRSGTEYACVQGYGIFDGPSDQGSVTAMKNVGINAVRVPLNEACWNGESYVNPAYSGSNYQSAIKAYVSLLNANGMVAILDLQWTDGLYTGNSAGCSSVPQPGLLARSRCRTPRRPCRSGHRSRRPSRATMR